MAVHFNIETGLIIFILTFIFVAGGFYALTKSQLYANKNSIDTLSNKIDNHNEKMSNKIDLNNEKMNNKIDSVQEKVDKNYKEMHLELGNLKSLHVTITHINEQLKSLTNAQLHNHAQH